MLNFLGKDPTELDDVSEPEWHSARAKIRLRKLDERISAGARGFRRDYKPRRF